MIDFRELVESYKEMVQEEEISTEDLYEMKAKTVPDKHKEKIARDVMKNPGKAAIVGPYGPDEAAKILKKLGYSEKEISKLKESVELDEAKMTDKEVLAAAQKLAKNGKDAKAKKFGQGLVDYYKKNDSFTPDQVAGLQNIMKNAGFQLAKESVEELDEAALQGNMTVRDMVRILSKVPQDARIQLAQGPKGKETQKLNSLFPNEMFYMESINSFVIISVK